MKKSKRLKLAPIITPDKRKHDEEYKRKLNESVNEIGKVYVRQEIACYRSRALDCIEIGTLNLLERLEMDLKDNKISGGQAHKLINKIIYGNE